MIFLEVYLIGYILSFIMVCLVQIFEDDFLAVNHVVFAIFVSLFSWYSILLVLFELLEEKQSFILLDFRKKKHK